LFGNIIRICVNTGFKLNVIEPCSFELDDKRLRRDGRKPEQALTISNGLITANAIDHFQTKKNINRARPVRNVKSLFAFFFGLRKEGRYQSKALQNRF
jgi:tRNA(Leu) C34 or U34 (ribose-2'-O)-methylase TrmL